jgi:hypothetical protein
MGRPAAVLRAEAEATGFWEAYEGDGASVPWQIVPPPHGLLLWAYKSYLDANWPEAFRLHDWLYTAYGQLINVTRLEADEALREEIAVDSPIDAAIVFAAVRAGGGPYFGVSLTGYPVRNMSVANRSARTQARRFSVGMKGVILFQMNTEAGASSPGIGYVGRAHVGGWSETVYLGGTDVQDFLARLRGGGPYGSGLLPARAALLPQSARIIGVRIYQVGGGKAQAFPVAFPGSSGLVTDVPQAAILCKGGNYAGGVSRRWTVRCIPDSQISSGEFSPSGAFQSAVQTYFNQMAWMQFLASDLTNPVGQIFSIDDTGKVTLRGVSTFAVNDILIFNRLVTNTGLSRLEAVVTGIGPQPTQFSIGGWPAGTTATGGTCTVKSKSYYNLDVGLSAVVRAVVRKIGRDSEPYRGRRSKRRKIVQVA